MAGAFEVARARGCEQAIIIGTDIADIEAEDVQDAFAALDAGAAVLNPAADGGFYLLGLNRPCPAAFQSKSWGSPEVFARTRELLHDAGLTVRSLRQRHDIDRPQDLPRLARQADFQAKLSIVIPTLSPVSALKPLLAALTTGLWPGDEIIVTGPRMAVPGNCRERFPIADCCFGVFSPMGRGVQLNAGVHHAKGNLLWFLHDDSLVPAHFAYLVRKLSRAEHMSLGCFELAFSAATPALRAIARWGNWRTRFLRLPYGDQGLFCRRETFDKAGGFQLAQLMEDVDFVKRCRLHGDILRLSEKLYTSPQRYLAKGILRASLRNHLTMLLYHLGWSNERLRAFYYG